MLNVSLFDVDVLVNGTPVRKYSHNGKVYIEARENTPYTIKIKNHSNYRKLVSCSIDGLNVLDGQLSGNTNSGYIINGTNSLEIKGFRVSDDVVNAFRFTKKADGNTYAQKSEETGGNTENCGVLGFKIYSEKLNAVPAPIIQKEEHHHHHYNYPLPNYPKPWNTPWYPNRDFTWLSNNSNQFYNTNYNLKSRSSSSCQNNNQVKLTCGDNDFEYTNSIQDFDMGTEFSDIEITDKVKEVEFLIGELFAAFEIYYASRDTLKSWGVILDNAKQVSFPNPYPTNKYCKPPQR